PRPLRGTALRQSMRAVRRTETSVPRHRVQGAGRDVLGGASVATAPPDARARAVAAEPEQARVPHLALVRPDRTVRGVPELDVRRPLARVVRATHICGAARAWLQDTVVDEAW